ncbi:helix-turn-helix domain-containing protein [Vibrio vulnificus]|nr:helix-turn-helix domain-containing protein [Vibrio vulnificus]MCL7019397.1 helix-turn-helix domain-containing protein [Vibrio vulnificus]HAS8478015.1 helix-turn-helix domain-containing protein [Vibrio vulnificus]HDY7954873.1 helix-turn-helix domain-containing protein [Vibrio vulnificus]HDY7963784.1 helix-turn-helix domain-containing protein [Vibrio vulnificus]
MNKWVQTFLEEGLEGLQEKPRTSRPAKHDNSTLG